MVSRRRLHLLPGAVLCAAASLAGCNCSSSPEGDLREVLGAYCDLMARCPDQSPYPIAYRDHSECVDILQALVTCHLEVADDPSGEPVTTLEKSTPAVDSAKAAACKAFLQSATCDVQLAGCTAGADGGSGCNPCSSLFATSGGGAGSDGGTAGGAGAALDQQCDDQTACAEGLYCIQAKAVPDGGTTCRVCKPLRPEAGDCADPPYVPCGAGLYCSTAGVCVKLLSAGTACQGGQECASAFCNPRTHLCDPGGHKGEACVSDGDCLSNFCDAALCSERKANGATCYGNEECQALFCDGATLKCGKPDGTTCWSSGECQGWCDWNARVCKAAQALGGSCDTSEQCQSRLCHSQDQVCATPCPEGADCPAGQFCDRYGACRAAVPNGSGCEDSEECVSGFCSSGEVCAAKPAIGDPCSGYSDCAPQGYCSGGKCTAFARPGESCPSLDACAAPFVCLQGKCTMMNLSCEPAAVGQQCAWLQVCDSQGYCDLFNQFTCAAKKAAGSGCLRSVECQGGLYCLNRTCATYAQAGAPCDYDVVCAPGLFCDRSGGGSDGVCSQPKPDGATCQDGSNCESGACEYTGGSGYVCLAACVPPPPGDQPACHPTKCADLGYDCGEIDGGCGEAVYCGRCSDYHQTCGGGGQLNVCGCTPTAACLPRQCGISIDDGCGHQVACDAACGAGTCGGGSSGVCGCDSDRADGAFVATAGASVVIPEMGGGFIPWENVDKVTAQDDVGAHVHFEPPTGTSQGSQFLLATGFGFALPPTASVNGVQVRFRRQATAGDVSDAEVSIFSGGKRLGSKAVPFGWDATWASPTYGGDGDLWSYPLTVDQVNAADFGVGVRVNAVGVSDAYVDDVEVTVHYGYRCDCQYLCLADSECGDDGCGGTCGACAGGTCGYNYCVPPVFVDAATGLMWGNGEWDESDCSSSTQGGYSDWRAPTIDELRTRIVGCAATAAGGACPVSTTCTSAATCLDATCDGCPNRQGPDHFGCYLDVHTQWNACTGNYAFFSSTKDGTSPYVVDFATGKVSLAASGTQVRYRCVRP